MLVVANESKFTLFKWQFGNANITKMGPTFDSVMAKVIIRYMRT